MAAIQSSVNRLKKWAWQKHPEVQQRQMANPVSEPELPRYWQGTASVVSQSRTWGAEKQKVECRWAVSPLGKCGQSILGCVIKNIAKMLWKINIPLKFLLSRWSCIFSYVFPRKDTDKLSKTSGRHLGDWSRGSWTCSVQRRESQKSM